MLQILPTREQAGKRHLLVDTYRTIVVRRPVVRAIPHGAAGYLSGGKVVKAFTISKRAGSLGSHFVFTRLPIRPP
jgi:hypothetical protein